MQIQKLRWNLWEKVLQKFSMRAFVLSFLENDYHLRKSYLYDQSQVDWGKFTFSSFKHVLNIDLGILPRSFSWLICICDHLSSRLVVWSVESVMSPSFFEHVRSGSSQIVTHTSKNLNLANCFVCTVHLVDGVVSCGFSSSLLFAMCVMFHGFLATKLWDLLSFWPTKVQFQYGVTRVFFLLCKNLAVTLSCTTVLGAVT